MTRAAADAGRIAGSTLAHVAVPQGAIAAVCIALAIGIQVQTTMPIGPDGIRVSLGDLILAAPIMLAIVALWRGQASLPVWRGQYVPHLLAAMTGWMLVALLLGYRAADQWIVWAWVNKGAGWLVLLCYLGVGAWLATAVSAKTRAVFFRSLLLFSWIAVAYGVFLHAAFRTGMFDHWAVPRSQADPVSAFLGVIYGGDRLSGFMVNPNAFGFAMASFIVLHLAFVRRGYGLPPWAHQLGVAICLIGLAGSGSRTAWVAVMAGIGALALLRAFAWRDLVKAIAVAAVLGGIFLNVVPRLAAVLGPEPQLAEQARSLQALNIGDVGVQARIDLLYNALAVWRGAPVVGIGLGLSAVNVAAPAGEVQFAHSTYLWLLTETGAIGLLIWVSFLALALRGLIGGRRGDDDDDVIVAVAAVLAVFMVMSLGMEAMYQRHVWLLLGIGLALPAARASAAD